jgi:beta-lactamase class A
MRFAWVLLCLGCSSGTLGEPGGADDTGTPTTDDTGMSIDDAATDTGTVSGDTGPVGMCGVIACDDMKKHYPRIQAAYDRAGGEPKIGKPKDNGGGMYVHAWGAGRVQDFDLNVTLAESDSTEDWASTGYAVKAGIRDAWLAAGGGPMFGYPIEDEHAGPGGQVQNFEKGCIGPDGSGAHAAYQTCADPPDLTPTLDAIQAKAAMSSAGTDFGIAVIWLPTGTRWGSKADTPRTSASSAKWFWAMAALNKADIATVQTPAIPTFRDSNNSTAGQLIDIAGGANAVNDFTSKTLGIPITEISLCGWSYDKNRKATNCSSAGGGDNFFTPNGAATFLQKSWQRAVIGKAKGDKLLEWATLSPRSGYGGWVGTKLPGDVQTNLRHKAGWLPTGCCSAGYPPHYNDIAIINTPRGPYAVVLSMKGGTDANMTKTMEWSSCVIWHALARDVSDPLTSCPGP